MGVDDADGDGGQPIDHRELAGGWRGSFVSGPPPAVAGHPDLVLARAVRDGILSLAEAALIGSTRLEALSIADAAAARGQSVTAATVARHRAEHRLRRYLTPTPPTTPEPDITPTTRAHDRGRAWPASNPGGGDGRCLGGRHADRATPQPPAPVPGGASWTGDAAMSALARPAPGPAPDLLAAPASATGSAVGLGVGGGVALAQSVGQVLDNLRNWLMGILAGLATLFLTLGGVRYVMAGGDPGEVERAKTAFRSAGIGYALAALAPLVVTVLKQIVGA